MVSRAAIPISIVVAALLPGTAGCAGGTGSSGGWLEPQGERWTIHCLELRGPDSAATVRDIAEVLKQTPGVDPKKVRVEPSGGGTSLYYGTYYRQVDASTRTRAACPDLDRDLVLLRELVDDQGRRCFAGARRVPAPSDDVRHPEWDLSNTEAEYTLQVAVYYNDDKMRDRKRAAVEKCRQLRRQGYEAYYYHGVTCSMVTVGVFGPEALVDKSGQVRYASPGAGARRQAACRYSDEVLALQNKPECQYNLTNDNIEYNIDRSGQAVPVRSLLVRVGDLDQQP